ncbi:uncharacterized protein [Fopius arisanus]|uniref:Uncharacterized protein isoform X3 n=1 Tax=Fopius arisanus TaxID=64838 RepID=A0A9R1TCU5_9HYME|nr:PREDICTED: uncharacterized protein LOC105268713 isoform X3 [Fopius arisanus]
MKQIVTHILIGKSCPITFLWLKDNFDYCWLRFRVKMEDGGRTASDVQKDEMLLKMQERLKAPLEWPSIDSCKILDVQPQHFDEVLRLIKRHYFKDDPMCASAGLVKDPLSVECYLDYIRVWMKDTTSLVALSSKSERVVGVVVARPNIEVDRSITYSRMQIHEGEVLEKIMDFKNTLVKQADVHNYFNCREIFRLYILCVHPSYRSKGLGTALLEAFILMAIALQMPAIVALLTSGVTQELAMRLGFKVLNEIQYSRWILNDKAVFINPGVGNYSAALFGMLTPSMEYLENIWRERRILKREEERRRNKRKHR